jgi:hypothetical protein
VQQLTRNIHDGDGMEKRTPCTPQPDMTEGDIKESFAARQQ